MITMEREEGAHDHYGGGRGAHYHYSTLLLDLTYQWMSHASTVCAPMWALGGTVICPLGSRGGNNDCTNL